MPSIPQPSQLINCSDLASCFQNLYNFFFAILIALAFLSFLYGAFLYLLSAGGVFQKERGKNVMKNSIIAVIIALIIPVILNMINPSIFKSKLSIPQVTVESPEFKYSFKPGYLPGAGTQVSPQLIEGTPNCEIPTEGHCSPDKLKEYGMGNYNDNIIIAFSLICKLESGGNLYIESSVDKCQDGNPFSIGLFQINMVVSEFKDPYSTEDIYCKGSEIFESTDGSDLNSNLRMLDNGLYNCRVKNKWLYNHCKNLLKNPYLNVEIAKRKYEARGNFSAWSVWSIVENSCYKFSKIYNII